MFSNAIAVTSLLQDKFLKPMDVQRYCFRFLLYWQHSNCWWLWIPATTLHIRLSSSLQWLFGVNCAEPLEAVLLGGIVIATRQLVLGMESGFISTIRSRRERERIYTIETRKVMWLVYRQLPSHGFIYSLTWFVKKRMVLQVSTCG